MAKCHPDRKHEAHGLCYRCYQNYRKSLPHYRAKRRVWAKRFRERNAERLRDADRRRYPKRMLKPYGLTMNQFNAMMLSQGGVCAICGRPNYQPRLHVDHCHKTGKVRALLCNKCNMGLGAFRDDATVMGKAIEYVRRYAATC